jgi:hypothetical protein
MVELARRSRTFRQCHEQAMAGEHRRAAPDEHRLRALPGTAHGFACGVDGKVEAVQARGGEGAFAVVIQELLCRNPGDGVVLAILA